MKHSSLVFPKLQSKSLLSIGQICDDGCVAIFDDKSLKIYDGSIKDLQKKVNQLDPVLEGYRNNRDGLYDVPFPQQKMKYIIQKDKSKLELAQYLHTCAFSPKISTFQ